MKGAAAARREGSMATGGAPTLRMHPRNPFLAYIHFRCDEVERARGKERATEIERKRERGRRDTRAIEMGSAAGEKIR